MHLWTKPSGSGQKAVRATPTLNGSSETPLRVSSTPVMYRRVSEYTWPTFDLGRNVSSLGSAVNKTGTSESKDSVGWNSTLDGESEISTRSTYPQIMYRNVSEYPSSSYELGRNIFISNTSVNDCGSLEFPEFAGRNSTLYGSSEIPTVASSSQNISKGILDCYKFSPPMAMDQQPMTSTGCIGTASNVNNSFTSRTKHSDPILSGCSKAAPKASTSQNIYRRITDYYSFSQRLDQQKRTSTDSAEKNSFETLSKDSEWWKEYLESRMEIEIDKDWIVKCNPPIDTIGSSSKSGGYLSDSSIYVRSHGQDDNEKECRVTPPSAVWDSEAKIAPGSEWPDVAKERSDSTAQAEEKLNLNFNTFDEQKTAEFFSDIKDTPLLVPNLPDKSSANLPEMVARYFFPRAPDNWLKRTQPFIGLTVWFYVAPRAEATSNTEDSDTESISSAEMRAELLQKPPKNYLCNICRLPGHFIKDCSKHLPGKLQLTPYQGAKRCYGEFVCFKCKKKWDSFFSWADKYQQCVKCRINVYPKKQKPIDRMSNKDDWPALGDYQKSHPRALCQRCIESGNDCSRF